MLVRIVKLVFKPENISSFENIFEESKDQIRNFAGCQHLELFQDKNDKTTFFTYSFWETENALENYRNSEFFRKTWSKTKVLFAAKPEAWSVSKRFILN
ncbi:putative quinol monooxygenase [Croceivirga thetidis]|uniref:Antibiotic biosynthesis monooxygenase n=1 Tax=Croceivirga thetidis TaxID=2721623 RepID=A0ABX1GQ48_9FLAO|nr:antibiotic biosynthesis monooxygenase family protein [Croceivirga thetidis]NKI32030.1 antibiotic biosynthesis monooxygenase [Croceivirga thetidis]